MVKSDRFCKVSIISSEGPSACGWRCGSCPGSEAYKSSLESGSDESVITIGICLGRFTAILLFLEFFAALCDLGCGWSAHNRKA